jgi:hypothetical protein
LKDQWLGFVDSVSGNRIAGWAAQAERPCAVDLWIEDSPVFRVPACLPREDLKALFPHGMRAFVIEVPRAYCDGVERRAKVCFAGTDRSLNGGEFRFCHTIKFKAIETFIEPDPSVGIRARQILTLLRPQSVVGKSKVRLGRPNDGGYVMLDHALDKVPVYSIGISNDVSWDLEMVNRGCNIFQYDHTIERLPIEHSRFKWERLGVAGATSLEQGVISMEDLIRKNNHIDHDDLILKLDVEGCEWGVFEKIQSVTLDKFSQIVVELHCLDRLGTAADYELIRFSLRKLAETHQVIHLHANNCGWLCVLGGVPLPSAMEVTYVRRGDHTFEVCNCSFPTPYDMPCRDDVADVYLGPLGLLPDEPDVIRD